MKKKILILILIVCSFFMNSCINNEVPSKKTDEEKSYSLAQEAGFSGSYNKWCELIDQVDASLIKSVKIDDTGELIVILQNEARLELGKVVDDAIPTYQGMTAEKIENINKPVSSSRRAPNKFRDAVDEFLNVITTEKIEHYTTKGENFNIIVHLYNPKSYEILSFTLNNIKYQAYEFKDGSTSTKLIIEVTGENTPGLYEYTIDAIKYIDGTTIKDAKMEGEKTIKVGVQYDNVPSTNVINEIISENSLELNVDVKDDNKLINVKNGLYFFLYDGTTIVYNQKLAIGSNDIKYDNLKLSTNYEYMIVAVYDDYSGKGKRSVVLFDSSFKSKNGYEIDILNIDYDSVEVKANQILDFVKLKEINLYDQNEKIKSDNDSTIIFNNLLSNHDYIVEVVYVYQYNNATITTTIKEDVKTLVKSAPVIDINTQPTNQDILYNVIIDDSQQTIKNIYIRLIKNDQIIRVNSATTSSFDNLLSNNDYIVSVYYLYDLNDGTPVKENTIETKVHTLKVADPTLIINNLLSTTNSITFDYELISDVDVIVKSIDLIQNDVVKFTLKDFNKLEFNNVLSNNEYTLSITYQYDLNDGTQVIENKQEVVVKTKALEKPTIKILTTSKANEIIIKEVILNDDTIVKVFSPVVIGDTSVEINKANDEEYILENAKSNHLYQLNITYQYDLNDGLGIQTENVVFEVSTTKQTPTITFIPYNILQNSVEYNLLIDDSNVTGRVNLITLYEGVTFVKRLNNLDTKIDGLKANTKYTLKINYIYDFDDGYGSREINIETTFTTLKEEPTYNLQFQDINKSGFTLVHSLVDNDNAYQFKQIEIYLEDNLVQTITDFKNTKVTNLLANNKYKVVVLFDKNLNNGLDIGKYIYYVTTDKYQTPTLEINALTTKTSISYSYVIEDVENISSLEEISLFYNGVKVNINAVDNIFTNLFSDSTYVIKISLLCDYHDGNERKIETYTKTVKTLPVEDILFNILVTPQKTKLIYNHNVVDVDNIMTIKEVKLYRGSTLVKTNNSLNNKVFDELYSNTTYKIVYVIEKDLNNNSEKIVVEYEKEVTTKSLEVPTIDMEFTSTTNTINYEFYITDNDNIVNIKKIDIYKNNQFIKSVTTFTNQIITDLDANTIYKIELTYTYNLNDLQGDVTKEVYKEYSTLADEVEVTNVSLLSNVNPKTNQNVNINIQLSNPSCVVISEVTINNQKLTVVGGDGISNVIVTLKTSRISGKMEVVVERVGYLINNETIEQKIVDNNKLTFNVFSRLDIVEINLANGTEVDIQFDSIGYVVTIDNPNDYIVKSISFSRYGTIYTFSQDDNSLTMIDSNHFYIKDIYHIKNICNIQSIVYVDDDNNETTRNYSDSISTNSIQLNHSASVSTKVNKISTPEELMNIQTGLSYELTNDIDMTGYNWNPIKFTGYFNGNGYKIKNLSYIHEDEWDYNQVNNAITFNLINFYGSFIFKNVYFENIYIDIDTTCVMPGDGIAIDYDSSSQGYTRLFSYEDNYINEMDKIQNVLFSGCINIKSKGELLGGYVLCNSNTYIVDHLTVNNVEYTGDNLISVDTFNQEEFRKNTLNWNFKERVYENYNGLEYYIVDNAYIVIDGYNGTSKDLIVPDTINGLKVIGINEMAFSNNTTIETVELPDSLCFIREAIFANCPNLEKIIYPNSNLRRIKELFGTEYFDDSYLNNSWYIPNKLAYLEIGSKSGEISYEFCSEMQSLKEVVIKEGVSTICSSAFWNCESLVKVKLPKSLTTIEAYVFECNHNLVDLVIPRNVTVIGERALDIMQTIYCEIESKPVGWNINCTHNWSNIVFGYIDNEN